MAGLLLLPVPLGAHAEGEDYVFLSFFEHRIDGHFEIHADDLREKLGVDLGTGPPEDVARTIAATAPRVQAYLTEHFAIGPAGDTPFPLTFVGTDITTLPQGTFARYAFRIETAPLPERLTIRHDMLYDGDRWHRGLVLIEYNVVTDTTYPGEYTALVFTPDTGVQTLDLTAVPSIMGPRDMIPQGVRHIWIGLDHILFLLALLLPTVLVRADGRWRPVDGFSAGLWNLLKIVTVFTLAHSVTLLLAALDLVRLPSRLVESVIALSIVFVALNNIAGRVRDGSMAVILVLGLFHGLGFASVLGHLPFRMIDLLRVVIGFNLGVELGQVAIVAVVFPLLFLLRTSSIYQPVVLHGVSSVLIAISGWWFIQRSLGLG